jgi:hypothetical protein
MAKSPVRRAFFILFIAAAVVAALLLLAQDQVTLQIRSAVTAAEPRHTNYVAGLLSAPVAHGNKFTVLTNGDQIFPAMLSAIAGAKRVQQPLLVLARRSELPHAPQDPRRRRTGRFHRRRRPRRPMARQRAGQGALARHAGPIGGRSRASWKAAFYENFVEAAGEVTPELDDEAPAAAGGGCSRAMVIRSSPTGGSNDLKRLYLLAIARRAARSTSPRRTS